MNLSENKKNLRVARRKFFKVGGGQMSRWGGTKIFGDGGGQVSMGGDRVLMGLGPPPSPPLVENPGEADLSTVVFTVLVCPVCALKADETIDESLLFAMLAPNPTLWLG